MNFNTIQGAQTLSDVVMVIGFLTFVLFLLVAFSIIGINKHLKELVDLEHKKYKENKKTIDGNNNNVKTIG